MGRNSIKLSGIRRTFFEGGREHVVLDGGDLKIAPGETVADNVRLVLELNKVASDKANERIHELLAAVGLLDRADSYPDVLSGGEQQRVAIARALSHTPDVLLADEPTGNLDEATAETVLAQLKTLVRDNGADVEAMLDTVERMAAGSLRVASNANLRDTSMRIFDRTFVITDVLYWLALGVAVIGILSAMLALQLERARELATLRALGMTPRQIGGMIVLQTTSIGFLSGLASIPLGITMAWVLIEVINRRAFGWQIDMAIAPGILASSVAIAIGAAFIAGLYPGWRAGQSEPAIAMREE